MKLRCLSAKIITYRQFGFQRFLKPPVGYDRECSLTALETEPRSQGARPVACSSRPQLSRWLGLPLINISRRVESSKNVQLWSSVLTCQPPYSVEHIYLVETVGNSSCHRALGLTECLIISVPKQNLIICRTRTHSWQIGPKPG